MSDTCSILPEKAGESLGAKASSCREKIGPKTERRHFLGEMLLLPSPSVKPPISAWTRRCQLEVIQHSPVPDPIRLPAAIQETARHKGRSL